jgi:hypothetical protein
MLASGMTIKFFPLFFGEDLGLSPIMVMVIGALGPLGITVLTLVAARAARVLGRVQTTLFCKASGISFLVMIAFQPTSHVWQIVCMYLVRTWLMNCTSGLTKVSLSVGLMILRALCTHALPHTFLSFVLSFVLSRLLARSFSLACPSLKRFYLVHFKRLCKQGEPGQVEQLGIHQRLFVVGIGDARRFHHRPLQLPDLLPRDGLPASLLRSHPRPSFAPH